MIAVARKRQAKRAESQRYRARKRQQRELAARTIAETEQPAVVARRGSQPGSRSWPAAAGAGRQTGRLRVAVNPGGYAAWLDERDQRLPLSRADLSSRNDDAAGRVVAAGGGMQALIEATGLRTRANVLRLIDPATVEQARVPRIGAWRAGKPGRRVAGSIA